MACWEAIDKKGGGTGVVIAPNGIIEMKEHQSASNKETHALLVTRTDSAGSVVHYAGYTWEGAKAITTAEQWQNYLTEFSAALPKAP